MSNLLEIYKKSIFSNLGEKVSIMQNKNIPSDIEIGEFKSKSILEVQSDFFEKVVLPFGTILENQSDFGDILVNPTEAIIDLFSRVNSDISLIPISTDSNLLGLNSGFGNIKDATATDLLIYSDFPTLDVTDETSVLSFNIEDVALLQTPLLENSDIPDFVAFETTNVLNSNFVDVVNLETDSVLTFNSDFDDIIEFKTTSVLDSNSTFDDTVQLPFSDVLQLNSNFDDLIIKDIGSVLKIYMASSLPSTTPGVVNFFDDIHASGFTPNLRQGESLFNEDTIPDYVPMGQTPDKQIVDTVLMPDTPNKEIIDTILMPDTPDKNAVDPILLEDPIEKPIADTILMPDTPDKNIIDPIPLEDPIDKPISDINPPAVTPEKIVSNIIEMPPTPDKDIDDVFDGMITPDKEGLNVTDNIITPAKDGVDVFDGMITPIKEGVDVFDGMVTPEKEGVDPIAVNFITDIAATGFTLDGQGLITEYNLELAPDLSQFNFNDASYGGVLNQYAVYFSKYPPLTNVTYKTVIDWAYNRTVRVPPANELLNEGFHTPLVPIGQSQLVIPPYDAANDRLPSWSNTYVNTLADVGSTLVSGFLSQRTIELLDTITEVDLSPWKESPVIFHQLAGEIYWQYSDLGTVVRNAREATINFASNLVGRTLAEYFIPKVESAIGGSIANAVNNTLNAAVLDDDKVLMLYHIFMGTKYTKSKAYFDRLTKLYSSKYGQIGDNAVNLYNDSSLYTKFVSFDSLGAAQALVPQAVDSVVTGIQQILTENGIETSVLSSVHVTATAEEGNSVSPLKGTLIQITRGVGTTKIPIGDYEPGLINKYITKENSKTFGNITDSEEYYSVDTTLERRTYTYDGPVLTDSIKKNYPTEIEMNANEELRLKSDLDALNGKTLADYNKTILTDFSTAYRALSPGRNSRADTYASILEERLRGEGKLLSDRGFPSIHSKFSDGKNRTNMIKMPEAIENDLGVQEYEDNDLVNFYFEDLSSLSDTNESILIPFRAIITTISDGTNANWSPQDYMGRADKFWIYQGFDRRVAINFEVALNSKDEFISSWNKINYLQGMCYPVEYPAEITLKAPIMALTVGNLFDRIQVIMNSINYSFDASTLWETEQGYQLPMHIKIAVDFTVIYADVPKASKRHIAQNQGWVDPAIFNYNESIEQSVDNQNLIITNEDGSIGTIRKSSNEELTKALPASNPVTFG